MTVSFGKQQKYCTANEHGEWIIILDPLEVNREGREMTVQGNNNTILVKNILVGEVWLCSGQSNMDWSLRQFPRSKLEIPVAEYPQIRFLIVEHDSTLVPAQDLRGHPPALLFSGSSDENTHVVELRTPNYVVGGMKNAAYQKDVQSLKDNSCLYVFSDGVYEFMQSDGSRWKYKEFSNYLRDLHSGEDKDIDRLVKSAKDLKQSNVFEDDFTILKVSFR